MGKITTKKEPCQRLGLRKKRRLARYLSLVRPLLPARAAKCVEACGSPGPARSPHLPHHTPVLVRAAALQLLILLLAAHPRCMLLLGHTFGMRPSFLLPSPTTIPKRHFQIDVCVAPFSLHAGQLVSGPDGDPTKMGKVDFIFGIEVPIF